MHNVIKIKRQIPVLSTYPERPTHTCAANELIAETDDTNLQQQNHRLPLIIERRTFSLLYRPAFWYLSWSSKALCSEFLLHDIR